MWEFIVSGQLPGTAIQISFESWMMGVTAITMVLFVRYAARRQFVRRGIMLVFGIYAAFVIRTATMTRQYLQA